MHKIKQAKQVKTLIVLLALAFTMALVPAVSAQPNKPLRCEVFIELVPPPLRPPTWIGTVSGDIEGDVELNLIGATFPGITEHYEETWEITTTDPVGSIEIYQKGVWSFKSFKFKSNGYVTTATGAWTYLVGADVHVRGVTTDPFAVEPCTGEGTMWICGYA